ncbi:MAG: hypothetical protein AB1633_01760 [Elusimicrobiota bacterium]
MQKLSFKTDKEFREAILQEKARGTPDIEIGNKYGVTFRYIEKYEEAYKSVQRKNVEAFQERQTREIIRQLREKEEVLPKPIPTNSELFGWVRLVYERLPLGHFKTRDIQI